MKAVYRAGRSWLIETDTKEGHGVSLSEWEKPGWTYHAKGDAAASPLWSRAEQQQVYGFLLPPPPYPSSPCSDLQISTQDLLISTLSFPSWCWFHKRVPPPIPPLQVHFHVHSMKMAPFLCARVLLLSWQALGRMRPNGKALQGVSAGPLNWLLGY